MDDDEKALTVSSGEGMRMAGIKARAAWTKFCRRHGLPANSLGGKLRHLRSSIERAIEAEAAMVAAGKTKPIDYPEPADTGSPEWREWAEEMDRRAVEAADFAARGLEWPPK